MQGLSRLYENISLIRQNLLNIIFHVFSFFYFRIYLILVLGLNLLIWLLSYYVNMQVSQDLVILHYNVDFGVDLIGNVKEIFIIPALGFIIILVNVFLLFNFSKHRHFKFLNHLLFTASILVNLFLLLALASIYLINFR